MAITTFDGFIAAAKQYISILKTGVRTTIAAQPSSLFNIAGEPGSGVLAGTSTTTGVVPTDATAGCPTINAFGGGATGYLAQVVYSATVAARMMLFDLLWKAGPYDFNANTSGQTPTSYSSRVPGGTDFKGLEIWLEQVTAGTGSQSVAVTYINQDGTAGRTTGTVVTAVNIIGRMWQLPLQEGDTGVQGVTGVVGSVASAGTFNILVMRRLWSGRVMANNAGDTHDLAKTGMPVVYPDSALNLVIQPDSTSAGQSSIEFVIANG